MSEVLLEEVPRKTRELFDKATAALERGNLDYALDMFLTILDIEPRLLQARKMLRVTQIKRAKEKGAGPLKRILLQLKTFPRLLAVGAQISKDPLKALQQAERLMSVDPFNRQTGLLVVKAAEAAEIHEAGIHMLEWMLENHPDDIELMYWLARLHDEIGDTSGARAIYEKIADLRPNDPRAIKALKDAQARDTMHQGRWEEVGKKEGFRLMLKNAEEAELLEQQAKAVKTANDAERLVDDLKAKIEREPRNINYRRALADQYLRLDRFDEALDALREADRISGGGDPQIDRAINAVTLRKYEAEIRTLRAAGRTAEADAKEREKDTYMMQDAARRVARYPNDLQFKYEYGVLLYEHGQYTEAIAQLQLAQRNPQRRLRSLYYLAMCFEKKGQLDIAVEQLKKALSETPTMDDTRKDVLYELGIIHEKMDQPEKALEFFKEIYAVDISFRDVAQKVERRSASAS